MAVLSQPEDAKSSQLAVCSPHKQDTVRMGEAYVVAQECQCTSPARTQPAWLAAQALLKTLVQARLALSP